MGRRRWERCEAFIAQADYGPRERWQHSGRVLKPTEQAGMMAAQVTEENMLDRLFMRRVIDPRGREAGLRLKGDYQAAHLECRIIASYNITRGMDAGGFQAYERSDVEEAAYRRWRRALSAVGAYERAAILDVCCHERDIIAPALPALRRGLARLGDWYRI